MASGTQVHEDTSGRGVHAPCACVWHAFVCAHLCMYGCMWASACVPCSSTPPSANPATGCTRVSAGSTDCRCSSTQLQVPPPQSCGVRVHPATRESEESYTWTSAIPKVRATHPHPTLNTKTHTSPAPHSVRHVWHWQLKVASHQFCVRDELAEDGRSSGQHGTMAGKPSTFHKEHHIVVVHGRRRFKGAHACRGLAASSPPRQLPATLTGRNEGSSEFAPKVR